ncbi:MAG: hypothetical protein WCJ06_11250, partial [Planctomycetota bacterium]
FSPRRRKERKVKQEILTCLLLLSGLSVFAVKLLSFGDFDRKARNHLAKGLALDEWGTKKNPWVIIHGF